MISPCLWITNLISFDFNSWRLRLIMLVISLSLWLMKLFDSLTFWCLRDSWILLLIHLRFSILDSPMLLSLGVYITRSWPHIIASLTWLLWLVHFKTILWTLICDLPMFVNQKFSFLSFLYLRALVSYACEAYFYHCQRKGLLLIITSIKTYFTIWRLFLIHTWKASSSY